MTTVLFQRHTTVYTVTFPYSPVLVNIIKTTVPGYARTWDQPTKQWTVESLWAPILAAEIRRLGHIVIGLDDPPQRPRWTDSAGWARAVFQRVGPTRAPLAYRLLSRVCHPDHGGDHHLQIELNRAYAELPTEKRTV
jgi:hypothetical protein